MRLSVALLLCFAAVCPAQMQLPPGTSSSIPENERQTAPNPQRDALQRAEDAIAEGRYAAAVGILTPFATSPEKNGRIFYDLGFAQDALGHDAEAAAAYRAAIARNAEDAEARVSLGLLLARGAEGKAAEEQLAAAVNITGAKPEILGRAYRALAQIRLESAPAQSREDLLAALKLSPETPQDALLAAQIADALHDTADAERAYVHARSLNPGDPETALGYARLLSHAKRYPEAEAALAPALKAHPDDRELLSEAAAQKLLQGQTAQAITLLEAVHASAPKDEPIARLLASAYVTNGTPEKANAVYAPLLDAHPDDAHLLMEWADCLIRQKRSPEAEPILQRVLTMQRAMDDPASRASAAGMLAFASSSNKDSEVTLKALATRETVTPSTAPYTFLAAVAHDTLHHTKQAAEKYRLFLQQSGGQFPDQEWQANQRLRILDRTR